MIKTTYATIFFSILISGNNCLSQPHDKQLKTPSNHEQKEEENYPGKVEVDQHGNKVKRWSTKGPVTVTELNRQNSNGLPAGTFINVTPNLANQPQDPKQPQYNNIPARKP